MRKERIKIKPGEVYGKWKVLEEASKKIVYGNSVHKYYTCLCECGTRRNVLKYALANGVSKSCGCVKNSSRKLRIYKYNDCEFTLLELAKLTDTKYNTLYTQIYRGGYIEDVLEKYNISVVHGVLKKDGENERTK